MESTWIAFCFQPQEHPVRFGVRLSVRKETHVNIHVTIPDLPSHEVYLQRCISSEMDGPDVFVRLRPWT